MEEGAFQGFMFGIMLFEKMNEIKKVGCLKCPVSEREHPGQLGLPVLKTKLVRGIIHQVHQSETFIDDGGSVSPGKNCRKETCNFDILLFFESVGNRNGILFYKKWPVIISRFTLQQVFKKD
jgi:hypothetical protein